MRLNSGTRCRLEQPDGSRAKNDLASWDEADGGLDIVACQHLRIIDEQFIEARHNGGLTHIIPHKFG